MLKDNNKNIRTTSLMSFWCFFVEFEHISNFFLVYLLLTLNKEMLVGKFERSEKKIKLKYQLQKDNKRFLGF